ncbi:FAR-17a/AIG1-like protein-domain-containing protein [Hypoxylon crocopeplum]|nr:FAR-17a/AIG1-like protein-domain-containing protein [Hypoxylon crocopeplum]
MLYTQTHIHRHAPNYRDLPKDASFILIIAIILTLHTLLSSERKSHAAQFVQRCEIIIAYVEHCRCRSFYFQIKMDNRHHPLQRLSSPSRRLSMLLHLAGITSFMASFRFLSTWDTPMSVGFGGHFQFLTIIGLALASCTFAVGFLADVTLSSRLFKVKNVLSACSAPLEVLISILYWGLCAIDKSLVFPPDFQLDFLPDFGFHAAPALFLSVDLILLSPPWTIHGYSALGLSEFLAFLYWFWVEYCFSRNGWYPYPIFDILSTWQRALLFTFSATLMTGSTMMLKWTYGKINGIEEFKKGAVTDPAGIRAKRE